jgi:hypothetical protein
LIESCQVLQELREEHEERQGQAYSNQRELLSDVICPQVFHLSFNNDSKGFAKLAYSLPEYEL